MAMGKPTDALWVKKRTAGLAESNGSLLLSDKKWD